jgi:hypothetical protein
MLKNNLRLGFMVFMLLAASTVSNAATVGNTIPQTPHYQVGWQFTKSGNGFSIKIPVLDCYYIQPLFAFTMNQKPNSSTQSGTAEGHFALGIRGIRQLPGRGYFQPYTGIGWGHSENFTGTNLSSATITKGNTGYEAFLGVEYQKYIIRPTLEIGLGSYNKADGSYYAGTTFNLGLMYSF